MPISTFAATLHDTRTQWLNGDAQAWARYSECCLQLGAEHHKTSKADRPSQATIPSVWLRSPAPHAKAA